MKQVQVKVKVIFAALFLTLSSAQADSDEKKPEEPPEAPFRGTIGPVLKMSQWGNGLVLTGGGRVNTTLFDILLLGVGGYTALVQSDLDIAGRPEDISHYYGAVGLGVRLFPNSFIHLSNYNSFGLGLVDLKRRSQRGLAYSVEPEVNLEFDLFSLLRIGAGASYRFLFAPSIPTPTSETSGFGGQLFVEFGWL